MWTSATKRCCPAFTHAANALHVNDLVDYVSESGETAGNAAAQHVDLQRDLIPVECDPSLLYVVPQRIDRNAAEAERVFFFRSSADMDNATLTVIKGETTLHHKKYAHLRPPEMERLALALSPDQLAGNEPIRFHLVVESHA